MATTHKSVGSLGEFVQIVSETRAQWKLVDVLPWLRGQENAEWSLIPKFYRQRDKTRLNEDNVREEFITRAPTFSDVSPANKWDWYFLMQHHRAPTRLLDWTEGALIGLYFAVRESPSYHDAAVWMLDPWDLNIRVVKRDEVVPPGDPGTTRDDRKRYDKWLPDRFAPRKKWPRRPVAIYPGHIMRRIGAQRSCFTIHGQDSRSLEQIAEDIGSPLVKITIPSWRVKDIRSVLETCGVDETTVFPDMEGLGKVLELRWMEQDEVPPHCGALTRLRPSKVDKHGVGVFALQRIRKNAPLFFGDNDEMVWMKEKEVPRAPKAIRLLYEDFAVIKRYGKEKSPRYGCPVNFNRLTISWYLNEPRSGEKPNVWCDENFNFYASRAIEVGEELTVDYSTYSQKP